ncbi:MAG: aldolase [Candidatus Hydrogenedentes bacterium]|nr:aldolase [Candidatus Hydrogenedentota bacterium]
MTGTELKAGLRAGKRVYGTCIVSPSPIWPPMIASVGLDFVFIDTEHIPIDRIELSWMCQTYAARGLPPIVRIPKPDPYIACMAIDGGALGVVAPYMESVQEVKDLRGAVKLRPLKGARMQAILEGQAQLEPALVKYLGDYAKDKIMIVNIESVPAINALDELLGVPEVDALLIGPHDLSISLGIPEDYRNPRFTEAVRRIIEKGRAAGVGVGYHYSFGIEEAIAWAAMGANLIVHSSDYFLTRDALRTDIARFRRELMDELAAEGHADEAVVI